jgi:hypothetical protein
MGPHGRCSPFRHGGKALTVRPVLKRYLPSLPQVSQEAIAILAATVLASWVISKVPAWRDLVRENSPPSPFNP